MTATEYTQRLIELRNAAQAKTIESVIVPSANELLANTINRIVRKGTRTDGGKIGAYSTAPMYASKEQFIKKSAFTPQGKNRNYNVRTNKKTGEQSIYLDKQSKQKKVTVTDKNGNKSVKSANRQTMYLPTGYKQLRDIQGRPTDTINENYTGDTMLSFQLQAVQNGVVIGMVNERAAKIRKGQEKRFGKIFSPTKEELENYAKRVGENLSEIQRKILNAK